MGQQRICCRVWTAVLAFSLLPTRLWPANHHITINLPRPREWNEKVITKVQAPSRLDLVHRARIVGPARNSRTIKFILHSCQTCERFDAIRSSEGMHHIF